jgi:hypothetical protein
MHWTKKGLIYCATGAHGFDRSHCHKPTPLLIDAATIRIFFGVRDEKNTTRTTFDRLLMFYNGKGFGKTGFGYAECRLG